MRLLGMNDEERLEFEQTTGIRTERIVAEIRSQIQPETEQIVNQAIREVQELVGPRGSLNRLSAGGVTIAPGTGVRVYRDGTLKTTIEPDGDLLVGSDISDPAGTSLAVFVNDQTYNNEEMGYGDLLIGDNTEGFGNVKYDASEGQLQFRSGQTVTAYMDTDGSIRAGGGDVSIDGDGIWLENQQAAFGFEDTGGNRGNLYLYSDGDDAIGIINDLAGKAIRFSIKLTDLSTPYVKWWENPTEANTAKLEVNAGTTSTQIVVAGDIILRANKDGTETVFNERSNDIDFRIEGATVSNVFKVDAGNDRVEIGADHYFPTRSSSNPNGFWNEANQDMDFTFEGDNAAVVFKSDAGADAAQFGSRIDITSDISPGSISTQQDNWNPTGLSTASVIRVTSAGADITGLAGGADGRIITLLNVGSDEFVLINESSSSTEANRFEIGNDTTVKGKEGIVLIYDATSSRWRRLDLGKDDAYISSLVTSSVITNEVIQDVVGAMFTGNTETNITVTYDDSDGTIDLVASGGREKLTGNRTYYVRSDGSDSNDGLTNSSGGAFATLQKAYDVAATLDLGGFVVTIKIGNTATLTAGLTTSTALVGGNLIIEGDTSTPSNTVVSVTSGNCFNFNCPITVTVKHLKVQTTTSGSGVIANHAAAVVTCNTVFSGACATYCFYTIRGQLTVDGNYTISGNQQGHYVSTLGGLISFASDTVTLSGSPVFSLAFAYASEGGKISTAGMTYSGSAGATTVRYTASLNAVINTFGGGGSYFPGTSAGTTATGGQYA